MDILAITIIIALWGAGCVGFGLATYAAHQRELKRQIAELSKSMDAIGPRRLRHKEAADIEDAMANILEALMNQEIDRARLQTAMDIMRNLRATPANRKEE